MRFTFRTLILAV